MGEQMMEQKKYSDYLQILKEELVPAMGCTEPIAIAYAAAKARHEAILRSLNYEYDITELEAQWYKALHY